MNKEGDDGDDGDDDGSVAVRPVHLHLCRHLRLHFQLQVSLTVATAQTLTKVDLGDR